MLSAPVWLLALAPMLPAPALSQDEVEDAADARGAELLLQANPWRGIGPSRGGRAIACAGVRGDPMTYYFGGTGGGVWKTTDAGHTWRPIADGDLKTGSVGAIVVADSDPNVIYVGMGESCIRGNFSHGDGVYRSTDAGKTWNHLGLEDSRQIGRIAVHPDDPDHVFVAALGHVFGPNEERGVYRSRNGGKDWERVHYVDENTGSVDLCFDPHNPRVLFAAFWQVKRTPWSLESGGEGSGLFRSIDGGDTWEELTEGLPQGIKGRIGVSASAARRDRVWAIVEAEKGGVFRSDDGGDSWRKVNDDRSLRQRAWYYTHIQADPQEANTVYVMNVGFHRSTDGGKSYERIRVPHGDNHDLWIDPDDNQRMVQANDGGANVSFDAGASWTRQDNQPTAQFYHVATDTQFPYRVYGAQQDNSTLSISSRASPFGRPDFYSVGGGESGYIAPHPEDPNIVYAGSYGGFLTRYDHRSRTTRNIMVWPENPMGWGADALTYRFQWTFPILVSMHDPDVLYVAGNHVFASRDEGQSWQVISPDLTTDDKSKQGPSGGPITKDNTSVEYYCTVFSLAESPHQAGVLWAGSDDGLVFRSVPELEPFNLPVWQDVTPSDLPEWSLISMIEVSPHEDGTVYVAVNRYKLDDFRPYVYRTRDDGQSWDLVVEGIDDGAFVRSVREDPRRPGLLYAATETGVYVSFDAGDHWEPLQGELPVVPVTDLVVRNDDLVIATQGRSFWILDDLSAFQQYDESWHERAAVLVAPRPTVRTRGASVAVRYYLSEVPEDGLTLEFLDNAGGLIKKFEGKAEKDGEEPEEQPRGRRRGGGSQNAPMKAGMNRFAWNLRHEDAVEVKGAVMWGGSTRGPVTPPGTYAVRLTIGDDVQEHFFELLGDPRLPTTQQEYQDQFELLTAIRDRVSDAHRAVNDIRSVRSQVDSTLTRAGKVGDAEALKELGKTLKEKLAAIEEELIQTKSKSSQDPLNYPIKLNNKIAALSGTVSGNHPPTEQAYVVFEDLSAKLEVQLTSLTEVLGTDLVTFNAKVKEMDVPAVVLEKEKVDG